MHRGTVANPPVIRHLILLTAHTVRQYTNRAPMKADKSSLVGLWDIASVSEDEIIELIDATASRNRDAFGSLFRHFAPRIKAYGIKGGASIPLAEELAQETMISVWRGAHSFDRRRASGSSWIFTIARNRRIDLWRREARPEIKPEDLEVAGTEDTQPDSAQEACEVGRHLRAAVDTLSPDQSMVLRKAFFEDKSHGTISDELELPLGTVKSRIRLGLARLKVLMAEFES